MPRPDDYLIEIDAFRTVGEAELAASALEAAGIDCTVRDQFTTGSHPDLAVAVRGVGLLVRQSDVEAAREVLQAKPAEAAPIAAHALGEGLPAECAECGRPLPDALATCPVCDRLEDRVILTPQDTYRRIVGLKLVVLLVTLAVLAAPFVWERVAELPETAVSIGAYGLLGLLLLFVLVRAVARYSDTRA